MILIVTAALINISAHTPLMNALPELYMIQCAYCKSTTATNSLSSQIWLIWSLTLKNQMAVNCDMLMQRDSDHLWLLLFMLLFPFPALPLIPSEEPAAVWSQYVWATIKTSIINAEALTDIIEM